MITIIQKFIKFYQKQGHEKCGALTLIDDSFPTTFVPSAGEPHIVKLLKKGDIHEDKHLLVVQPCFRNVDIGRVGNDYHLSFFEMLAAFSFIPTSVLPINSLRAEYLRDKQLWYLRNSFQFLTEVLNLEKERIWVTIFGGDRLPIMNEQLEPDKITLRFLEETDISNIIQKGAPDNYLIRLIADSREYSVPTRSKVLFGDTDHELSSDQNLNAYAGKRIEVFYDRGKEYGCGKIDCKPTMCDCQRFVEISTSGFLDKYVKHKDDKYELTDSEYFILYSGYGLERLSMIVEGKKSIYEIEQLSRLTQFAEKSNPKAAVSKTYVRRLADFTRGVVFIIAAGVSPGKKGRELILKSILRKVLLYSDILNIANMSYFEGLVSEVINTYERRYPYLSKARDKILDIITGEWKTYDKALRKGTERFKAMLNQRTTKTLTGKELQNFGAKYSLPMELVVQVVKDGGFVIQ